MALPKIDVPTYETKLISNGKKIKFRPFLVKEQKLFLMASQSDDQKEILNVIKQVINNCVLNEINVDELPTFDLEHLFIHLRARSVGEVVSLKYNCNNLIEGEDGSKKTCGGVVKFDLNILEIEPVKNKEHTNKIALTQKLGMVMKYPNIEMMDKINISDENIDVVMDLIVNCIDYIYDDEEIYYAKDSTKTELIEFIENMQQNDLEKVQKFFETMPRIKKDLHFKCPKCKYEDDVLVEGIQNFFV